MLRAKDEIVRKFMDAGNSKVAADLLNGQLSEKVAELKKELDALFEKSDEIKLSCAVPYKDYVVVVDVWNCEDARAALVLWASTDKEHAGEKDFIDWTKFVKGFGWVDLECADKFVSYKFVHHTVKDDDLVTVWLGVAEAMAKLLADKSITDAKLVYDHLAAHYAEFDKAVPEFERDYTEEELALISEGKDLQVTLQVTYTESEESESSDSETESVETEQLSAESVKILIDSGFAGLKAQISELEDTVRLRMNILGKLFDEMHKDVLTLKEQPKVEDPEVEDEEAAKALAEELMSIASIFENIR
jgi:hypothetical protein